MHYEMTRLAVIVLGPIFLLVVVKDPIFFVIERGKSVIYTGNCG
jgi:hypothetical protein